MRADSLGRWYARCAAVCALGTAALAFAAGPAAADTQDPSQPAGVDQSESSVSTTEFEFEWGTPADADRNLRLLEFEWG